MRTKHGRASGGPQAAGSRPSPTLRPTRSEKVGKKKRGRKAVRPTQADRPRHCCFCPHRRPAGQNSKGHSSSLTRTVVRSLNALGQRAIRALRPAASGSLTSTYVAGVDRPAEKDFRESQSHKTGEPRRAQHERPPSRESRCILLLRGPRHYPSSLSIIPSISSLLLLLAVAPPHQGVSHRAKHSRGGPSHVQHEVAGCRPGARPDLYDPEPPLEAAVLLGRLEDVGRQCGPVHGLEQLRGGEPGAAQPRVVPREGFLVLPEAAHAPEVEWGGEGADGGRPGGEVA